MQSRCERGKGKRCDRVALTVQRKRVARQRVAVVGENDIPRSRAKTRAASNIRAQENRAAILHRSRQSHSQERGRRAESQSRQNTVATIRLTASGLSLMGVAGLLPAVLASLLFGVGAGEAMLHG